VFIERSHLTLISVFVCSLFLITLSHLSTQMRWPDSESRMWRSLIAPLLDLGAFSSC
jgi:hypothetical protein